MEIDGICMEFAWISSISSASQAASEAAHYTAAPFEAEDEMAVAEALRGSWRRSRGRC